MAGVIPRGNIRSIASYLYSGQHTFRLLSDLLGKQKQELRIDAASYAIWDRRPALTRIMSGNAESTMKHNTYQPWRPEQFPRLGREIVAVRWHPSGELTIEVAEGGADTPSLAVTFAHTRAYQGVASAVSRRG